jgi:hypothetical protein
VVIAKVHYTTQTCNGGVDGSCLLCARAPGVIHVLMMSDHHIYNKFLTIL